MAKRDSTKPLIADQVAETIDTASLAREKFAEMVTLFDVIQKLTDANSDAHQLAKIGSRLADESWSEIGTELEWLEHLRAGPEAAQRTQ